MTTKIKDGTGVIRDFQSIANESDERSFITISRSFELAVTMGQVSGYSTEDKFGENPDIDTGTPEDIWEFGGIYTYDTDGTAPILYLSSSDNADMHDIRITGLDINGAEVIQTITLTGQTNALLTTPLWRAYRLENEDTTDIAGVVYCHTDPSPASGVPSDVNVRAIIDNGNNQTLMAIYTVPLGKVGFLYRGEFGMSRSITAGYARGSYQSRRFGKVFKIKKRVDVTNSGSSFYQDARSFPDVIPALTDIKLRVEEVSANNTGMFGTLDMLLVDESEFTTAYLQAIGQPGA